MLLPRSKTLYTYQVIFRTWFLKNHQIHTKILRIFQNLTVRTSAFDQKNCRAEIMAGQIYPPLNVWYGFFKALVRETNG